MGPELILEEFSFDGQQDTRILGFDSDAPFPLALQVKDEMRPSLQSSITALKDFVASGNLFHQLQKHGGAVLIRGLPIKTPQDYSDIAHAFGFRAHEEVGRPPLRTVLAKNVKTANEG